MAEQFTFASTRDHIGDYGAATLKVLALGTVAILNNDPAIADVTDIDGDEVVGDTRPTLTGVSFDRTLDPPALLADAITITGLPGDDVAAVVVYDNATGDLVGGIRFDAEAVTGDLAVSWADGQIATVDDEDPDFTELVALVVAEVGTGGGGSFPVDSVVYDKTGLSPGAISVDMSAHPVGVATASIFLPNGDNVVTITPPSATDHAPTPVTAYQGSGSIVMKSDTDPFVEILSSDAGDGAQIAFGQFVNFTTPDPFDVMLLAPLGFVPTAAPWPHSHTIVPSVQRPDTVVQSWTPVADGTALLGGYAESASTGDDEWFYYQMPLAAGTWELAFIYAADDDAGIATFEITGLGSIGTEDTYQASPTVNNRKVFSGIVVPTSDYYDLLFKNWTKNGSSSAYTIRPQALVLRRTGA